METTRTPLTTTTTQIPAYGVLRPGRIGEDGVTSTYTSSTYARAGPTVTTSAYPATRTVTSSTSAVGGTTVGHDIDTVGTNGTTGTTGHVSRHTSDGIFGHGHRHGHHSHSHSHKEHGHPSTGHHHGVYHHNTHKIANATEAGAVGAATGTGVNEANGRDAWASHQSPSGNHLIPGMEGIGSGYSGIAAAKGDITAPTGSLPPGTIEKGATEMAIPRPSAKDYFKMSNASTPSSPRALAHRPVGQDPISEADHIPHGANPGVAHAHPAHQEAVDPYAAKAHGDHLVRGLNAGTGYAGYAAASGDIHAPTGTLPAGTTELGATGRAMPRPSPKDFFKMSNASTPASPRALAHRPVVSDPLGPGTDIAH